MFNIVRWSMFLSTIFMAIFGYSDQLRIIFFTKSIEGLSFLMILLGFWVWLSYALYGFLRRDYKILLPNIIGTVLIGIILVSFLIY